jgi:hypothetical protein
MNLSGHPKLANDRTGTLTLARGPIAAIKTAETVFFTQTNQFESGEATVTLTQEALRTGALHLVLLPVHSDDAKMHEFLRHAIYRDQTLMGLLRPAC